MTRWSLTPADIHPWVRDERIRFGVSVYPQPTDWREFINVVVGMEEGGLDSYWCYDHPTARADCWTALSALALATKTIKLGTIVNCIYYRGPYLLARQAADVDRLSGGRLLLGLGVGDNVPEFEAMGIPFPPVKERQEALEETIEIVRRLWSGERFEFSGKHFSAKGTFNFLPPVQQPHVPILIAGGGEKVTLRQVARYADASNMGAHEWIGGAVTIDDVSRKFAKLDEYCDELNRPREAVLRSHFTMPLVLAETRDKLPAKLASMPRDTIEWCGKALFAGTPDEAITFYQQLSEVGFRYFIANILEGDWTTIHLLTRKVAPVFA